MVMTFVLHPLSHYNSITESHARFLLSLLEDISIDFPSHFIRSLIDVYRDTTTRDKLIFPSAITRILCHFSVPFPVSPHFSVMGAIDVVIVQRNEAQLRLQQPQTQTAASPTSLAPSTSALSSSMGGVILDVIMARLQRMDACLDTFSDELCYGNTRVGRIARRQARLGGFVEYPSPSPEAFENEDDDGDSDDDGDEDDSASSPSDDEMST